MRGRIMNRLTKRDLIRNPSIIGVGNYYLMQELYVNEREKVQVAIEKLAKLEDLEEELGIDLFTLFIALKDGFYVKTKDVNEGLISLVKAKDILSIDIVMRNIVFVVTKVVLFEDYGKTWALTKEELEVEECID